MQAGGGIAEGGKAQDGGGGLGVHQQGVHLVGGKLAPQGKQIAVSQGSGRGGQLLGRAAGGAVAVHQHIHGVLHLAAGDLSTDAAQRQGEKIQPLELDRLVGGTQHTAALFQGGGLVLQADGGGGKGGGLIGHIGLQVVVGGKTPVIGGGDEGAGGHDGGKRIIFLHALADGSHQVFGEQHGALSVLEELLQRAGVAAAHLNIKALELALEGIQMAQLGAAVIFGGVHLFQPLGKALAAAAIQGFLDVQLFVVIIHVFSLLFLIRCKMHGYRFRSPGPGRSAPPAQSAFRPAASSGRPAPPAQ